MATYLTKKFKMITRMRNNKGFTLIELIMVTILLGILAAVAVPRYLGTVSKAEEAVEKGVGSSNTMGIVGNLREMKLIPGM